MDKMNSINELRRIFNDVKFIENGKYQDKIFYGCINGKKRIKASFVSFEKIGYYSALRIEIINQKNKIIDSKIVKFDEVWDDKPKIILLEWDDENYIWIGHYPTASDMKIFANRISEIILKYR